MPSTTIQRGNVAATIVMNVSLTPTAVGATTSAEQQFTIPGLQFGDQVSGLLYTAPWTSLTAVASFRVPAANTLGVSFQNGTAGSLTPPAGNYLVEINRPEFLPYPSNAG